MLNTICSRELDLLESVARLRRFARVCLRHVCLDGIGFEDSVRTFIYRHTRLELAGTNGGCWE
jgi:hypothetical protein